ncbi:sensor histidine kinase [Ruminococcus sp.]|uniref:sensor histidine kinase n=1 Tax=Ruminococcus sp. TaxID=41978 RepID=UPI0025E95E40|nr:sensor histidine kinase [Ruminococcus sp.]
MILYLVNLASAIATFTFAIIAFEKLFSEKHTPLFIRILFLLTVSPVKAFLQKFSQEHSVPWINPIITFLLLFLLATIFNKNPSLRVAVYVLAFITIMAIVEVLTSNILGSILDVDTKVFVDNEVFMAGANLFEWIIMLVITKAFITIVTEKGLYNVRTNELIMFMVLILGEIILLSLFHDFFVKSESKYEIIIILSVIFVFDLYLTYVLRRISQSYRMEKELDLLTQQSQLQLNAYKVLNEKYTASRHVIHDVKKHLASLDGLINDNNIEEAKHYKELLTSELDKLMPRFECDNAILTVVVNNKMEAADKLKIDFQVDSEYTNIDFISNLDITAIFSNLLDNAFEACSELPEKNRHVSLSIKRHNHFVFILLENTCGKVISSSENKYLSTKKNHQGIGMSNIKNACKKYDGSFNAHTENGHFITEVLIPIPDYAL